jgi:hypothetical protein
MEIILILASVAGGAALSFLFKPDEALAFKLARAYIGLVLLFIADTWLFYFAGIKGQFAEGISGGIASSGKYPARILLGYLVAAIFVGPQNTDESFDAQKLIRLTLTGVSLATGLSFLMATEGKAANLGDMLSFFKASGYAPWFLYFIMTMETFAAIGILLHFKLKTGPLATMGLMLIMIGAMYTHRHNNDPLSDSYAAVGQFITLGAMLVIYYFEREACYKIINAGKRTVHETAI